MTNTIHRRVVIIHVKDGIVQDTYSDKDVSVIVIDEDNAVGGRCIYCISENHNDDGNCINCNYHIDDEFDITKIKKLVMRDRIDHDFKEKDFCQHDDNEDCMFCSSCGAGCREDLDGDDQCPTCQKDMAIEFAGTFDDIETLLSAVQLQAVAHEVHDWPNLFIDITKNEDGNFQVRAGGAI